MTLPPEDKNARNSIAAVAVASTPIWDIIIQSGLKLGFKNLRDKQVKAVSSFIKGNDVFVFLPAGYGKSLDMAHPGPCNFFFVIT